MRRSAAAAVVLCAVSLCAVGAEPLHVGVLEFEEKNEVGIDSAGVVIPELLVSDLKRLGAYELNERVYLRKAFEEQQLQLSGAIDERTAAEVGKTVGLEGIVVGSVMRVGEMTTLSGRVVDVETGRILQSGTVRFRSSRAVEPAVEELAYYLSGYSESEYRTMTARESLGRTRYGVSLGIGYSFNHAGATELTPLGLGLFFESLYVGADVFGIVPVGNVSHFAARVVGYPIVHVGAVLGYLHTFDDMLEDVEGEPGEEFYNGEYDALLAGIRIRANEWLSASLAFGPTISGTTDYQSTANPWFTYEIDTFFEFPPAAILADLSFAFTENLSATLWYLTNGGEGELTDAPAGFDGDNSLYHDASTIALTASYSFSF
jgi:hypothetical protein